LARRTSNLRYGLLSLVISGVLWGMAHGSSSAYDAVPDDLVITDKSADQLNIRVLGSRASLRNVSAAKMQYVVNVSNAKPGPFSHEVEASRLEMPRGTQIVSRSPARIDLKVERRGRKSVRVRPDMEGEVAPGFVMGDPEVDPPRVWLTGARGDVLRLAEVVTETIDVTGLDAPLEREVRLSLRNDHVWMEESQTVIVRIPIEPVEGAVVGTGVPQGGT
jgi:YbbR domain-containing protein